MKKTILFILLILSLAINIYVGAKWLFFEKGYEPTQEESNIMSEMMQKTVESLEYENIAKKEKIIAINSDINKYKGGQFPFNMEVSVRTDKKTYLFSCANKQCSKVEIAGTTASIYQDEKPRLPLNN